MTRAAVGLVLTALTEFRKALAHEALLISRADFAAQNLGCHDRREADGVVIEFAHCGLLRAFKISHRTRLHVREFGFVLRDKIGADLLRGFA